MAIYRGTVVQSLADHATEVVVATGLCCATPFQVLQLNMAWFQQNTIALSAGGQELIVTVQSVSGSLNIGDVGVLAVRSVAYGKEDLAEPCTVILPVQSTTGNIIIMVSSVYTGQANSVSYVLDVNFSQLKELDYMRLKASGY